MTFDEIAAFLKDESINNYILLTHKSPDGDTLGSGFALCRVLKDMIFCTRATPRTVWARTSRTG